MDIEVMKRIEHRSNFFEMFNDFESSCDLDDEAFIKKYNLTDLEYQALSHCLSDRELLLNSLYEHYFFCHEFKRLK